MEFKGINLDELLRNPSENYDVEVKNWFELNSEKGISKIVKGCIALRNNNGGYLIIGFDDETLQPNIEERPTNVIEKYNPDTIQEIVSKYSSELFEATVYYPVRDGLEYPVICIKSGIETPVATKKQLNNPETNRPIIPRDAIYVRTTASNNRISSSKITFNDLERLTKICFDNREADIARFIQRHLIDINQDAILKIFESINNENINEISLKSRVDDVFMRFKESVEPKEIDISNTGFFEVGFKISGEFNPLPPNMDFLRKVFSNVPQLTGWPFWLDSRNFAIEDSHPKLIDEKWESCIIDISSQLFNHIDFWQMDPKGFFYHLRALEDDIKVGENIPAPYTVLDFGLPIIRVSEVIVIGLNIAKAIGCKEDESILNFLFKWSGLLGRELDSWANPMRIISPGRKAYRDEGISEVTIPLNTANSSISHLVEKAISPLFDAFDFKISLSVIEELNEKLLTRKL